MDYVKRPETFEAHKVEEETAEMCTQWCGGGLMYTINAAGEKVLSMIVIKTGRAVLEARPGNYILKNNLGEFSVLSAPLFEAEYVELEPPAEPAP